MNKKDWRLVYTNGFPKMIELSNSLEASLQRKFPEVLAHLQESFIEIYGTFSPHFMTLFIYSTPIEISTRLFEIFIIDGENALVNLLLKMIELKTDELLARTDAEL